MTIPSESHSCWAKLATNQVPGFQPKQLALQLFFTRLFREKLSPEEKSKAIQAFFVKYQPILTWEIQELQRLKVL